MNILEVSGLGVTARTSQGTQVLLDDVSLVVRPGEMVGLVGESGSGKTTLARSVIGLLDHNLKVESGKINLIGIDVVTPSRDDTATVRGRHVGMIFQDAGRSLNPLVRVRKQILEVLRRHQPGMRAADYQARMEDLMRQMGVDEVNRVLNAYPHQLSGGQRQRVAIALAVVTQPELVIADECTTALDVTTQAEVVELLRSLVRDGRTSLLFVTHDLLLASEICDRIMVMYAGQTVELGAVGDVLHRPRHPYTSALLQSVPSWDASGPLRGIPGSPPRVDVDATGCRFAPRCAFATDACDASDVPWTPVTEAVGYRCLHPLAGSEL